MPTVQEYLDKLASQHRDKPKLEASITAALEPMVDTDTVVSSLSALFDVDLAVGQQLDYVGLWVGASRQVPVPLTGVYFSFDDADLGFDLGTWLGPFDPLTGLVSLPDDAYRLLIYVRILNNQWNGSIPAAYEIWDTLFEGTDYRVFIVDHGDLTMSLGLLGFPDALTRAMFTGGLLNVKPAGVRIDAYLTQSGPGPMFAFDLDTDDFAGLDEGLWAIVTVPP